MAVERAPFRHEKHQVDFCIVGGGMAGLCAAVAAARHGAKVALMQDRPVLGGNASSEIRMWVCGARGRNMRETGIVEEMMLDNHHRNPSRVIALWDSILYEYARYQPNLQLFLNCSCTDAKMESNRIVSVTGWQTTTQKWQTIEADYFADCSGDSVLAPLTGAEFRVGREARSEFGEAIQPEVADNKTMGMSCLIQLREYSTPQTFVAPPWANRYNSAVDFPERDIKIGKSGNFWWLELGGEDDSIHDTEELRDELLKAAFGVWDLIKNREPDPEAANWALDWIGFLPGKRESRRYVGDYIMTQNDIESEGRFDDVVAYGGWSMDDHHPAGLRHRGEPTIHHPAPSPYGITYRSLYSRNIENLFFAGRNISVTHAALSSTRVMATCAIIGQAVGTAAALAVRDGLTPREVGRDAIRELQQTLLDDDCYLPWLPRQIAAVTQRACLTAAQGDPAKLLNGVDRPAGSEMNDFVMPLEGAWLELAWEEAETLQEMRLVCDSDLNRDANGGCHYNIRSVQPLNAADSKMPGTLLRDFRLEALDAAGEWQQVATVRDNLRRMVKVQFDVTTTAIRLIPERLWDETATEVRLFAWEVK